MLLVLSLKQFYFQTAHVKFYHYQLLAFLHGNFILVWSVSSCFIFNQITSTRLLLFKFAYEMTMKALLVASLALVMPSHAIDFQVRFREVFQDQRGTESGNEEYTMLARANVGGYTGPNTCIQCTSSRDCRSNGVYADSGRRSTSSKVLKVSFTAWEDDTGNRCSFDNSFFNSDDDRVSGECYFTMTNYVSTAGWHNVHCVNTDAWIRIEFRWWPDPTPAPPTPAPHYCTTNNDNCDAQYAECFLRDGVQNQYHCECRPNYVCVSGCDWPFNGHRCHRNCVGYACPNVEWQQPQNVACSGRDASSCNNGVCCPETDAPATPAPTTDAPPTPSPHDCSGTNTCDANSNCFAGAGVSDYVCICRQNYICETPTLNAGCAGRCLRSCAGYTCPSGVGSAQVACSGTDILSCNEPTCCPSTPVPHQCDSGSHTCDVNSECRPGKGGVDDYVCICKDLFVCEEKAVGQGCPGRCVRSCFGYNCVNGGVSWAEPSHVGCSGTDFSSCNEASCCPSTPVPHRCDSGTHTCDVNSVCHPGNGVDDYVCICKDLHVCEHNTIGQGCNGKCLRSCSGYTCATGVHWPEPAQARCSGSDFSSCNDDTCCPCYSGVGMTAAGGSNVVDIQPMTISNGELDLIHTRYVKFPTEISSMSAFAFPRPVLTGSKVHLKCCDGEKCSFAFALYRCTDCTGPKPFGMTQQLLLDNWDSAACSPKFDTEFSTSLFYKNVDGHYEKTFELQHDELFVVLMKNGELPVPLCDKPHGPFPTGNCGSKCPTI